MSNKESITKLEESLERLKNKESVIYFLTYDTRNNARASVKHIYDLALTLKERGFNAKILVEDKTYVGVSSWLGDEYNTLPILTIKDDRVEIQVDDAIVVPEFYSNVMENLANIKCTKIMLVQQRDYIFETLPIGSRWSDYGFDFAITTTQSTKDYINKIFPEAFVHIIPPMISDNFRPNDKLDKPIISILCRDRSVNKRIISEFYLKYPQLRWITFRDMNQLTYEEFADSLRETFVSVWVDDESTFGTFPLECMKSGVPLIAKIPNNEPDWIDENAIWTYDISKMIELLGTYVLAWLDGVGITEELKTKMKETLLPYETEVTKNNIESIFNSFLKRRIETIEKALSKVTIEETA